MQALAIKRSYLASLLFSFAPTVLWSSWWTLVVPVLVYSNDLADEISCIFWFTGFRLCLPVWIRQTSCTRILPRYHIGAFSVQGFKADLVAGGTSCSFLGEQHSVIFEGSVDIITHRMTCSSIVTNICSVSHCCRFDTQLPWVQPGVFKVQQPLFILN